MVPDTQEDRPRSLAGRAVRISAAALVPVLLVLLLWKGANAFLLLFAGYLLSVLLRSAAGILRRTGLSYEAAFTIVCVLIVAAGAAAWIFAGPGIQARVNQLSEELPRAVDQVVERYEDDAWFRWVGDRVTSEGESGENNAEWISRIAAFFGTSVTVVSGAFVILFVGLYLGAQPGLYRRGMIRLVPPDRRHRIGDVASRLDDTLSHWLMGKIVAMTVIGLLTWGGLALLDIPLPVTLAVLAGLLTFIPNFGPIASAIPPILLALTESPVKALWVVFLFLGIQTVESYLVTPMIMQQAIDLPPAMILAAQVLLSVLFGFLGLLVATPLVAASIVLVQELYVKDVLERDQRGPEVPSPAG